MSGVFYIRKNRVKILSIKEDSILFTGFDFPLPHSINWMPLSEDMVNTAWSEVTGERELISERVEEERSKTQLKHMSKEEARESTNELLLLIDEMTEIEEALWDMYSIRRLYERPDDKIEYKWEKDKG